MDELKTKYITADDFKQYFGIDLNYELKEDDNPSNTVNAFLTRIETRMETFLDANFYRKIDQEYPTFTDYQKKHYKLALLEQAYYVLTQGDISVDSGYNFEEGIKASRDELHKIKISDNCKEELLLCGLWCRKINSRVRSILNGWWLR